MKKYLLTILCCFQIIIVLGQSSILVKNQSFDDIIWTDSSSLTKNRLVNLSLNYSPYSNKKDIVNLFINKFGIYRNTGKLISWKPKSHLYLKKITLDTTNNSSVLLKFKKNINYQSKQMIINEINKDLKRTLMLWIEKDINDQEIYFVGHRGGLMNHFQENTNDILKYSKQSGISFMEVDILISKDNIPFMGHDWKYLEQKLRIRKTNDSLEISKAKYEDGQKITFFSTLIDEHQFLILDLIHNTIDEQRRIVQYLYKNYPQAITSHTYIQIDKFSMFSYIKNLYDGILVSYNFRSANTGNWRRGWADKVRPEFANIEMFVINPSSIINKKFLTNFDDHVDKIIPVIYKDNTNEIIRMVDLGFKFIMIDDIIFVNHKLNETLLNRVDARLP